ncbi:MAG: alpha/beta hydrolase [Lachnospiraceae bacterium]|nr:alpha/beta hydrolase [Lachnospiraceae bacterium]
MNTKEIQFTGANGITLPGTIWYPDGNATMVVQIAHGMTEHIGRYEKMAEYLVSSGIVVAGFDLRGHGRNPGDSQCASFGEGGWDLSIQDMHLFYLELENRFPGIPHFMLGFSLGFFLLRDYLSFCHDGAKGAIIMGTGHQPGIILNMLMPTVKREIKVHGFDSSTKKIDELSFENYNRQFAPNMTPVDWLCADTVQRQEYREDPLCRKTISAGLFWQLLDSMRRTGKPATYRSWNKKMPVLLLSGQDDPVGDKGKGVQWVRKSMSKAGMQSVQMNLISGARHDLFHEEESGAAAEALDVLKNWLFEHV